MKVSIVPRNFPRTSFINAACAFLGRATLLTDQYELSVGEAGLVRETSS